MHLTYEDYLLDHGVFRQRDLTPRVKYDAGYLQKYKDIADKVVALSEKRAEVLTGFTGKPGGRQLLDFGCGTGAFVEAAANCGWHSCGYDVAMQSGVAYSVPVLDEPSIFSCGGWEVVTFFDSLEHLPDPADTIRRLNPLWLMVSVPHCHYPNFPNWFMPWKHRRPGEHLWHFTRVGLDTLMHQCGYQCVAHTYFEDEFRPRYDPALNNILTGIYREVS